MFGKARFAALALVMMCGVACRGSSAQPRETRYTVVKPPESPTETGGVPPEKEAEIQLMLRQREASARRCYQDVLNQRKDRSFQGTVKVLIRLDTTGRASDVRVIGGTLPDEGVRTCLIETIREFEFPALADHGEVQYEYLFRPAY